MRIFIDAKINQLNVEKIISAVHELSPATPYYFDYNKPVDELYAFKTGCQLTQVSRAQKIIGDRISITKNKDYDEFKKNVETIVSPDFLGSRIKRLSNVFIGRARTNLTPMLIGNTSLEEVEKYIAKFGRTSTDIFLTETTIGKSSIIVKKISTITVDAIKSSLEKINESEEDEDIETKKKLAEKEVEVCSFPEVEITDENDINIEEEMQAMMLEFDSLSV